MESFKTKFPHLKAIVFDLDDTLYDRNIFEYGAYKKISTELEKNYSVESELLFDALKKINLKKFSNYNNLFKESLTSIGIFDDNLVEICIKIYRSYDPKKLKLFEGVRNTLEKIKNEYKIGLITNGRIDTQRKKIKALQLENFFKNIVFPSDLGRDKIYNKPHIKPYQIMSDLLQLEAKYICYIGDNPYIDFKGAKQLNMTCIRVLTGEYKNTYTDKKDNSGIYLYPTIESIFNG